MAHDVSQRLKAIRETLARLADADREGSVFGASDHQYTLAPPLGAAEVAAFEQQHAVSLPPDYRAFLIEVAAAGAGPGYGLLPPTPIVDDAFPRIVSRITTKSGEVFESGTPWRPEFGLPASPGRPFLLRDAFEPLLAYDLPPLPPGATPYDGCLRLCEHGCGYFDFLVVSGPFAGQVWSDTLAAVHDGVIAPTGLDFLGWYERWLQASQRQIELSVPARSG